MADTKKPIPSDEFGDDTDLPKDTAAQTIAEQNLELERLRAALKQAQDAAAPQFTAGVIPVGDPNESPAGVNDDDEPMFWYKIDLPPSGGTDIKICGVPFYHGQQYKVDVNQLRSLREIVARTWAHEQSIRGSNENFYRKPTERVLRGSK